MSKSLNQFSSSFVCLAGRAGAAYLVTSGCEICHGAYGGNPEVQVQFGSGINTKTCFVLHSLAIRPTWLL